MAKHEAHSRVLASQLQKCNQNNNNKYTILAPHSNRRQEKKLHMKLEKLEKLETDPVPLNMEIDHSSGEHNELVPS